MSENSIPVEVYVLDKSYKVACLPDERDDLLNSAHYLNERMREMRSGGRVVGAERIAVITALNITHEFLKLQSGSAADPERIESIRGLSDRIETTLNKHSETSV